MPSLSKYSMHKMKWKDCSDCDLCSHRSRVILGKGTIPCDVLFIGEAPGDSEDVLGAPFVGPAGRLLDDIVEKAVSACKLGKLRFAYTNIVACAPPRREPSSQEILSCSSRLLEFVDLCNSGGNLSLIVSVGSLSDKACKKLKLDSYCKHYCTIVHPSAILRAEKFHKDLQIEKAMVSLCNIFTDAFIPF